MGAAKSTSMIHRCRAINGFHLAGTLDDATGSLRLYVNGVLGGIDVTTIRPFGPLQSDQSPGVAIGGLQSGNPFLTPEKLYRPDR